MISYLLHCANASPPMVRRKEFYALKDRLMRRFGEQQAGNHVQEIEKECWGPYREGCPGAGCRRCGGSGIFDHFFVELEVWQWGRWRFHRPLRRTWSPPVSPPHIKGYIRHGKTWLDGSEARLWLYLVCGEWRLWWRTLRASRRSPRWWQPMLWPMLSLQALIWDVDHKLGIRRVDHKLGIRRCQDCRKVRAFCKGYPYRCRPCWLALFRRPPRIVADAEELPF